jgi:hypothetical protein
VVKRERDAAIRHKEEAIRTKDAEIAVFAG